MTAPNRCDCGRVLPEGARWCARCLKPVVAPGRPDLVERTPEDDLDLRTPEGRRQKPPGGELHP